MPADTKRVLLLPPGVATPRSPPPRTAPKSPPPRDDEEAWGRWKEQRDDETGAGYLARIRSMYGKERPTEPKSKEGDVEPRVPASSSAAPSKATTAAPNAANYYQVDGGDWYWWDGSWGKHEPKKKRKKKKYTKEEWEQWCKDHPKEAEAKDTGASTSRKPVAPPEPEHPPEVERPRIRPGLDLIRRPENKRNG